MMVNGHELYTDKDFENWTGEEMEDSWTARAVLDGGLGICKKCGDGESGLDFPCKK